MAQIVTIVPDKLCEQLEVMAEQEGRSRSSMIRVLLQDALKQREFPPKTVTQNT